MKFAIVDPSDYDLQKLDDLLHLKLPDFDVSEFQIDTYHTAEDFLKSKEEYDVVISEIELPGMNGLKLAEELLDISPITDIVFGTSSNSYAYECYELGVAYYYQKPVTEVKIEQMLNRLI